jgi:hypothetical protein
MLVSDEKQPAPPDYRIALWIGAGVLVGVAIMISIDWPTETSAPASGGTEVFTPQSAAPPPAQSPRAVADQLFNRAMMAYETGQTQQAAVFLPEAIAAYRGLEPLDTDGLFHLALLQISDGDAAGSRATADRILATSPDHLLGLAAAAQASEKIAPEEANGFWQRYLDAFAIQQGRGGAGYEHHQQLFPILTNRAKESLARAPGNAASP